MSFSSIATIAAAALSLPKIDEQQMVRHLLGTLPSMDTGPILVEIFVAPDKDIEECRLLYFGGSRPTGRQICRMIAGQEAKQVGTGPESQAVYGITTFRMGMTFGPDARRKLDQVNFEAIRTQPEIAVTVASLPPGRATADVLIYVDEAGAILNCNAAEEAADVQDLACAEVRMHTWAVRRNDRDVAVPYVRAVQVGLVSTSG